jgi:hypothetical protein
MNMHRSITPLVIGLLLGVLGTIFLPAYVRPYLPQWIMGKTVVVKGTVAAKQKKDTVLLLTVDTPEGAMLATFNRKVDEINLLVNENDGIELTIPKYMPFVEDPRIVRVVKGHETAPEPAPATKPKEGGVKESKAKKPEKAEKPEKQTEPAPTTKATGTNSSEQK